MVVGGEVRGLTSMLQSRFLRRQGAFSLSTFLDFPLTSTLTQEIVDIVAQLDPNPKNSAIVVNCQLGRGRSTRAQVIITLVQRWLRAGGHRLPTQSPDIPRSARYSYTVINNLLRTIRWGQEVKNAVDDAITACGEVEDIFDSIEEARQAAEDIKDDEKLKKVKTQKGIQTLR